MTPAQRMIQSNRRRERLEYDKAVSEARESTSFWDALGSITKVNSSLYWNSEMKKLNEESLSFEPNEEFLNRENDQLIYQIMSENQIHRRYWDFMSSSQSQDDLKHRARTAKIHQDLATERQLGASRTAQIMGAVAGRFAETDVLASMIIPPLMPFRGVGAAGTAKTAMAVGLGANVARTEYEREDVLQQGRLEGEVLSDAIFGAVVDATLIRLIDFNGAREIIGKMRRAKLEEAPLNQTPFDKADQKQISYKPLTQISYKPIRQITFDKQGQRQISHEPRKKITFDKAGQKQISYEPRIEITFDKTASILNDANKEGVDILVNNLTKEGFEPALVSYVRATDDIVGAFEKANDALLALSRSEDRVRFMSAYQSAKKEFFEFADSLKVYGDKKLGKALDSVKKVMFRNDTLRPFDIPDLATLNKMKDEISNIKSSAGNVKKYASRKDAQRLDKRREWIKSTEKQLKAAKKSKNNEIELVAREGFLEPIPKIKLLEDKLSKHKAQEAKIIDDIKRRAIDDLAQTQKALDDIKVTKDKKGNYFFGGKKLPLALAAALIAGGQLKAAGFSDSRDDGTNIVGYAMQFGALMAILSLGILGTRTATKTIRNRYGTVANMVRGKRTEQYKALKEQQKQHRGVQELANDTSMDELRSNPIVQIIETVPSIRNKLKQSGVSGKDALNLVESVFYDPLRGSTKPVGEHSVHLFMKQEQIIEQSKRQLYKKWVKENEISIAERTKTAFSGDSVELAFEKQVANAMEGLPLDETLKGQEHIRKYAETLKSSMDELKDIAKSIELENSGAFVENYLPREMNGDFYNILNALRGGDNISKSQLAKIKETFTDMLHSGLVKKGFAPKSFEKIKTAKNLDDIKDAVKSKNMSGAVGLLRALPEGQILDKISEAKTLDEGLKLVDELEDAIKGIGAREYSAKVIDDYIDGASNISSGSLEQAMASDVFRSFKARLPFDLSKFSDMQIRLPNGEIKDLKLSSVFNRDATALTKKYARGLSGRIGLKNAGYSIDEVKRVIDNAPLTKDEKTGLNAYINSLTGTPNYDMAGVAATGAEAAGAALLTVQMTGVGISFTFEALRTFARMVNRSSEAKAIIKELPRAIMRTGDDSVFGRLMKEHAFGSSLNRQTVGLRGEENLMNQEIGHGINQALRAPRAVVFKYMGLNYLSDLSERINMAATFDTLTKVAKGKVKLTKTEMKALGWTKSDEALFKKAFKLNKEGYATDMNYQSLSFAEKDRINTLHVAMNNTYAQRTHLGTSPSYAYTSHIGANLMRLMSWVSNSFSNIGLRDGRGMLQGDMRSMNLFVSALVGNYLSIKLRDEAMGRDRDEMQVMEYAVRSLPIAAPLEFATAALSGDLPILNYGQVTGNALSGLADTATQGFQ